jgi:hypothetical protein
MQDSEFGISIPYVDLEQAITDIVESVALEENALSVFCVRKVNCFRKPEGCQAMWMSMFC